jgi:hypothetical protein
MHIDPLKGKEHEFVGPAEDDKAVALLTALKLIDRFENGPALPLAKADGLLCLNHPTHWIIAVHFTGYAKTEDNGYFVDCWPKSLKTEQEAEAILKKLTKADRWLRISDEPGKN